MPVRVSPVVPVDASRGRRPVPTTSAHQPPAACGQSVLRHRATLRLQTLLSPARHHVAAQGPQGEGLIVNREGTKNSSGKSAGRVPAR